MRRRRVKNKAEGQRIHCNRRAIERLGYALSGARLRELVQMIQAGQAECEGRRTNRITIFKVDGIRVAYDKSRKTIASVLPMQEEGSEHGQE